MRIAAALALALVLPAAAAAAETAYYRSNASAMLLERLPTWRRDEASWLLEVDRAPGVETRILFQDGAEQKRWEKTASAVQVEEKESSGGQLVARRLWDARGTLLEEDRFADGAPSQRTVYAYSAGRLIRARTLAADGSELFTDDYLYAVDGSLRSVRRTPAGGTAQTTSIVAGPNGIAEERTATATGLFVDRYDARGRRASSEERSGGAVVSRTVYAYRGDSGALASSTETRPGDGVTIERAYDDSGRLVKETTTAKAGTTVVTWSLDADGRVTGKESRGPGGLETWRYTLQTDGTVSREEYARRGTLEKVTIYGDKDQRTEELYDGGELVLTVTWDGQVKVKEEVWSGGTLVRTRTYP